MTPRRTDRIAGLALLALSGAAALAAISFRVAFLGDPIGPRAIPWLGSALLAAGGLRLVLHPDPDRPFPPRGPLLRIGVVLGALALYPALLSPLGFPVATTLLAWVLSLAFEARPGKALLGAALLAAGLYLLFGVALGVPLPSGTLWGGS